MERNKNVYVVHTPYQLMAVLNIISESDEGNEHIVVLVQQALGKYIGLCDDMPRTKAFVADELCINYRSSSVFLSHLKMVGNIVRLRGRTKKIPYLNVKAEKLFLPSDDVVCRVAYYHLQHLNKDIRPILFDDGLGTYDLHTFKGVSILGSLVYSLTLNGDFSSKIKSVYCYQPDLMAKSQLEYVKIHSDNNVRHLFKSLVGDNTDKYIGKKVVFLDQGLSERKEVSDSLALLSKYFKREEVIVKLHPRVKGLTDYAFGTSSDTIPFEVLLSTCDFSECILMAHSSGGIINSLLMFGENKSKVLYLIKVNNEGESTPAMKFFERVQDKYGQECLFMPETIREVEEFLKKNQKIKGVKPIA